jgi:hypothetical protein
MEEFRGRLALKVARLTQDFLPESDGRNRGIQQMAHFVPNRCHTPIYLVYDSGEKTLCQSILVAVICLERSSSEPDQLVA